MHAYLIVRSIAFSKTFKEKTDFLYSVTYNRFCFYLFGRANYPAYVEFDWNLIDELASPICYSQHAFSLFVHFPQERTIKCVRNRVLYRFQYYSIVENSINRSIYHGKTRRKCLAQHKSTDDKFSTP